MTKLTSRRLNRNFLAACALVLSSAIAAYANADPTVEVPGQRDCDGIYSAQCGWGGIGGESGGGGGSGGSSGGSGGGYTTAGTTLGFNREAECEREAAVIAFTMATVAATQAPYGVMLPITLVDNNYNNGQWIKMEADSIQRDTPLGPNATGYTTEYFIRVHYMYNISTHQTHQVKLKNSFQSGCAGFKKPT